MGKGDGEIADKCKNNNENRIICLTCMFKKMTKKSFTMQNNQKIKKKKKEWQNMRMFICRKQNPHQYTNRGFINMKYKVLILNVFFKKKVMYRHLLS